MKGTMLTAGVLSLALLGGCSTMKELEVRQTKAHPTWYEDCKQIGSEGFLFWKTDYAYSCGMGQSKYEQASESQAYAFAVKGFAERINGEVNSSTTVELTGNNLVENRVTRTVVEHSARKTSIREHVEVRKYAYELESTNNVHTYVRIKMPLEVFDRLLAEAKQESQLEQQAQAQ